MTWPNAGNIVRYVQEDGKAARGVISRVIKRGNAPVVMVGVFGPSRAVESWATATFDPTGEQPGSWHYPPKPLAPGEGS